MIKRITVLLAVVLTARLGVVNYEGHRETFYNLNMEKICSRAAEKGIQGTYWEREDGAKMFGDYIIVATDWNLRPYGSIVETSLGQGIVLDTGGFKNRNTVDIATTW